MFEQYKLKLNGINYSQLSHVSQMIQKWLGGKGYENEQSYKIIKNNKKSKLVKIHRCKIKLAIAHRIKKEGKQFLRLMTLLRSPFVFKSSREQFKKTMFTVSFQLRLSSGLILDPFIRGSSSKKFLKQQYILENLDYNEHLFKNFSLEQKVQRLLCNLDSKIQRESNGCSCSCSCSATCATCATQKRNKMASNSDLSPFLKRNLMSAINMTLTPYSICKSSNGAKKVPQEFLPGSLSQLLEMLPNGVQLTLYKKQYDNFKSVIN